MLESKQGKISSENITDQSPAGGLIERWGPKVLSYLWSPFPQFVKADVSLKPDNWDITNLKVVRGAQLDYANLRYANATHAFVANASLEGANLEWANLRGADFRAAKLTSANLERAYLIDALFQNANLTAANLYRANLLGANFSNADLTGARLQEARLHGAQFHGAKFLKADLRGAQFQPANIGRIEFAPGVKANRIVVAAFTGADLTGADLELARLEGVQLDMTRGLTQAQIDKACVDDKTLLPAGMVRPPPCPPHIASKFLRDNFFPQ